MTIDRYLVNTCMWQKRIEDDYSEFGEDYEKPVEVPCFKYDTAMFGGKSFNISGTEIDNSSSRVYLVKDSGIKEGDLIDDQIIVSMDEMTDLRGKVMFRVLYVK